MIKLYFWATEMNKKFKNYTFQLLAIFINTQ